MTSSRPYLIRAIYEWLVDNELTPYVMIDANLPHVQVPERFIEDGKIVLNVAPRAVINLIISNEALEFDASFSGMAQHIYVPIRAVKAIYSFENGRGMVFSEEDEETGSGEPSPQKPPRKKGKPKLKIVK